MGTPRSTSIAEVLTTDECGAYLGVTRRTLRKVINDPETPLPHHRLGPSDRYRVKFPRHRVDDWRQEHGKRFRLKVPRQRPKSTLANQHLSLGLYLASRSLPSRTASAVACAWARSVRA